MKPIRNLTGIITKVQDLTPTARDVTIELSEPLDFVAGSFVNVFVPINGKMERRAFSISSSEGGQNSIILSIRLDQSGLVSPLFWEPDCIGRELSLMGPLGLNTADKMQSDTLYLFGFGIGAGVVKSLAEHMIRRKGMKKLVIVTGNRGDDEIVHHEYFDDLADTRRDVSVEYIVSKPASDSVYKQGYIQDHLDGYDFTNADIYICGQKVACDALTERIEATKPTNCHFFVEDFH